MRPEPQPPAPVEPHPGAESASDEITDAEFEALLDQLHGAAAPGAARDPGSAAHVHAGSSDGAPPAPSPDAQPTPDSISEAEFEALLDELQAKAPSGPAVSAAEPVVSDPAVSPGSAPVPVAALARDEGAAKPAASPTAPQAEATVRVDTHRLDEIMNLVGELVLARNRLDTLKVRINDEQLTKALGHLDLVTSDLQAAVMKTRMQPIKKVFGRFPRVVRDLARSLKKEVALELQGEETDLDKNLVEALADPLVHLVRNSVDHGIEAPEAREAVGKPRGGKVTLAAEQEGDHILLTIRDDGAGINPQVLRRKAVEKGLMDADSAARLTDSECYNLIFLPGLSTKAEISDVSGRGVGMDVVKTRIAQLNGTVTVDSALGTGTSIRIKVPLTLAIMPTLMVQIDERTFALPLSSVSEVFPLDAARTNVVDGQLVVMVRNKALPLFYLQRWLSVDGSGGAVVTGQVVTVHVGNQRVGFVVDRVLGQEEVVIKPLGALLRGLAGFAGATITGDGRIALILDIPSLMKAYARRAWA